jgi:hypothetical protein
MAGSGLAHILIPIAALAGLAFWIFMVFYADSHPTHGSGTDSLDSGEYDTGLQGPYLTKPELRMPRQERRRLDDASVTSGSEHDTEEERAARKVTAGREAK